MHFQDLVIFEGFFEILAATYSPGPYALEQCAFQIMVLEHIWLKTFFQIINGPGPWCSRTIWSWTISQGQNLPKVLWSYLKFQKLTLPKHKEMNHEYVPFCPFPNKHHANLPHILEKLHLVFLPSKLRLYVCNDFRCISFPTFTLHICIQIS